VELWRCIFVEVCICACVDLLRYVVVKLWICGVMDMLVCEDVE